MESVTAERVREERPDDIAKAQTPPLRLPKYLLRHLAAPITSEEDVDRLIAQIRLAEWRGLL
ncbi:MAG: hypothetical protein JWQ07_4544 [Ramlibacter sp.]|nr:hypothetical protein [Ramlibacter sp.]